MKVVALQSGSGPAGIMPLLRIENLSVRIGIRRVLDRFSLDVFEGDQVALTGPNGCGKSTLLNALAGLGPGRVEYGGISIAGRDITMLPAHVRARLGLAYLRQRDNTFADLTVEENLQLAIGNEGLSRFREACPVWASAIAPRTRVGLLSGGQRQRLAWAMATLRPFKVLLLDEAEAGMADRPFLPPTATCILVTHAPTDWVREAR